MIIQAKGWDRNTRRISGYHTFAFDTRDVLYVRGYDTDGDRCIVYLRHNITEASDGSETTYPLWIGINMSVKEMMEKLKGSEE